MQVAELAERLGVPYRDVRYVLEQGILPKGVEGSPGRGEHRDLDAAQTFWLAIVLKLKGIGMGARLAGETAEVAMQSLRGVAQHAVWEHDFHPAAGRMQSNKKWFFEIGDATFARIVTDANPSVNDMYYFPWSRLDRKKSPVPANPLIVVRIDLVGIAGLLA